MIILIIMIMIIKISLMSDKGLPLLVRLGSV